MPDYTALRGAATSLITQFGATATFTRTGSSTFDSATGSYSGGSTVTVTGKGARLNFTQGEIDGQTIQRDDVRLVFQSGNGAPLIDDNCSFDSVDYRVMDVRTVSPSGTDVYYDVQLRH